MCENDCGSFARTGKFLAIDCEMVGIGTGGSESSLGRVSVVNYYGAVQLDEFVKQREKVVDYRTQHSGIRAVDMIKGSLVLLSNRTYGKSFSISTTFRRGAGKGGEVIERQSCRRARYSQ
jgi:hypothetical protein